MRKRKGKEKEKLDANNFPNRLTISKEWNLSNEIRVL